MQPGTFAADEASGGTQPDPRLTLILSLFALLRAVAPDPKVLHRLVAEVAAVEMRDRSNSDDAGAALSPRCVALCATAVRRFLRSQA